MIQHYEPTVRFLPDSPPPSLLGGALILHYARNGGERSRTAGPGLQI